MNPSDARIEHLLQEAGWLRCLARNLVDPSRVDDVVQDTWLAALRKGPGLDGGMQHGGMRPWLGRVARNLASNLRRDERRRRQRDAAARAEPAEATPDDLAQAAELQRLLATAIERLPESMRDVIVLAYFHGLDSRQIGQRLGLSPSAVRTRHQRAIEELRKSLDSSSSRREAWLAMAVRFLGNSEGAIVRRSAAWLAWSCAAVTVAATATAHLAGWLPGSAADTPAIAPVAVTAPPATTPAPDPAGTLRTAAAPEAAVTPSPSTPPAAPATAAITGRLLVDGGLPAWELRLRLVDEPDPTALPEPAGNVLRERRAPRRDELLPVAARGAFRFEGLPAGWRGVLLVEGCTALDGGPSVPIASPSVDLLVALRAGPRLSGRVQLPDNGPVASEGLCEVRTGPAGEPATRSMVLRFRTAADGEFSLPILTKAEQVSAVIRLEVDGRGFPHHETARLDARTSHDLGRLAATPVRDLQVLVVDRAGQPLAGASVQVDGAGQACREVTTDANGACTLRFVPARLCSLRVNAAMHTARVVPAPDAPSAVVELLPIAGITLRIAAPLAATARQIRVTSQSPLLAADASTGRAGASSRAKAPGGPIDVQTEGDPPVRWHYLFDCPPDGVLHLRELLPGVAFTAEAIADGTVLARAHGLTGSAAAEIHLQAR